MLEEEKKWFHEVWAEEEKLLKIGLEVSRRNKKERFNKSPAKKLVDEIEGRIKNERSNSKRKTN